MPELENAARPTIALTPATITRGLTAAEPMLERTTLHRLTRALVIAGSDTVALLMAAAAASLLWALPVRGQSFAFYLPLAPLVLLFLLGYAIAGLYPGFGLGPVETVRRLSCTTAFGFLVLAAFSFVFKLPPLYSRVTFGIACALALLLVPIGRSALFHFATRWSWWPEPVVVIGQGRHAEHAIRSLVTVPHLGYRPALVLVPDSTIAHPALAGVPVIGGLEHIPVLSARGIRTAFLETQALQDRSVLDRLQQQFRHVVLLRQFDDLPVEGLQIRNLGPLVGIEYTNNLLVASNRFLKRVLDLTVGTLSLVLAGPIILCAAALVKMLDPGPAFFFQDRNGMDGRRIAVPKVRTMRVDAEQRLKEYLTANPKLQREWEVRYKLANDPRLIAVVGHVFRRFSIDELPQLWSVIRGDMSLVGPRPFPDYHTRHFSQSFQELRQRVRPGISGLWQVTIRSDGTIEQQQAYDSYYIRNWSLWLDFYILSRTISTVLTGRGAY